MCLHQNAHYNQQGVDMTQIRSLLAGVDSFIDYYRRSAESADLTVTVRNGFVIVTGCGCNSLPLCLLEHLIYSLIQ